MAPDDAREQLITGSGGGRIDPPAAPIMARSCRAPSAACRRARRVLDELDPVPGGIGREGDAGAVLHRFRFKRKADALGAEFLGFAINALDEPGEVAEGGAGLAVAVSGWKRIDASMSVTRIIVWASFAGAQGMASSLMQARPASSRSRCGQPCGWSRAPWRRDRNAGEARGSRLRGRARASPRPGADHKARG